MKQGWEIKKLGEVCEILCGSTPKRTDKTFWDNGTYPWFTIDDIREQGHHIYKTKQQITKAAWDKMKIFPENTVMLCCTASIGEYAITKIPLTSNQQFNGLIIRDKKYLSPMFLMYYCSTLKTKLKQLSGKATIDFVSGIKVKQLPIPVPPLPVQERIVSELDLLSGIIEKKREQLKELDALAQSIFYDMFGDPITNEKGWEVKKLGEVADIIGGSTPKTNIKEYWDGDNYWVTPAELHGARYICSTERRITNLAVDKTHLTQLPVGTVLLSSRAPIGKVCITRVPMYCNQGFKNI
ncbi:MAG: restriction endonuclease subunit S, partial [Bacteroidaceae bacterium]|nr:restriction endonuclease subunit S [Bacteroidaceae bacterium]